MVTTYTTADGKQHVYSVEPFNVIKKEGDLYTFQVKHSLSNAGSFKVSYRMFPKIRNFHIVRTSAMFAGLFN